MGEARLGGKDKIVLCNPLKLPACAGEFKGERGFSLSQPNLPVMYSSVSFSAGFINSSSV